MSKWGKLPERDLGWRPPDPVGPYRLFLDDLRFPAREEGTAVARSSGEAIEVVRRLGVPAHVDYDHDLGGEDTAMAFVNWLVGETLDGRLDPSGMTWAVHSSNPVGRANIDGLMGNLLRHLGQGTPAP